MHHFCTYFDRNYLIRGLALYWSLSRHAKPFFLYVLCFDDMTYDVLKMLNRPNLHPISLGEFESGDKALLEAKKNRSSVEYFFTCTPSLVIFILNTFPEADVVTYLDADLFFYANPLPVYEELGEQSVLIVEHRFPRHLLYLENRGIYNVGLVAFRNDEAGKACVQYWRDCCLKWCYDRVECGRFADQKYLDDWPKRFRQVKVLQHKGAGLSPWNWMNYDYLYTNKSITVDGQPLIFYHFHGFKVLNPWLYDMNMASYGVMPWKLRQCIYVPYTKALKEVSKWLPHLAPKISLADKKLFKGRQYEFLNLIRNVRHGQLLMNIGPIAF